MTATQTVGNLVVKLLGDASSYQNMLQKAQRMTASAAASIGRALNTKIQFGGIESLVAGAGLGAALGQSVRLAAQAETTQVAFETMLGSAREASKLMAQLQKFGAETPFELPEITEASKKLLAFGTSAAQIQPTLRMLGDLSAGLGVPLTEMAELYGKMQVQGRLFAEDMNQLQGRGIPIAQELAKQFGVQESEVRKLVESGKVGFENVQRAMAALTAEGSRFGGMMEKQAATLAGRWSTLKDTVNETLRSIGESLIKAFNFSQLIEDTGKFVTFFVDSWAEVGLYTINSWSLTFVSMYESVKYFFTDQLWPLIQLYPKWWVETFKITLANAAAFGEALWVAIQGGGWDVHWTGFSDAFIKEVNKIPRQADRVLTPWEIQMQKDLDMLARKMGKSWERAFGERKAAEKKVELELKPIVASAAPIKELDKIKAKAEEVRRVSNSLGVNKAVMKGTDEFYELMSRVATKAKPRKEPGSWLETGAKAVVKVLVPLIPDKAADVVVKELKELVALGKKQLDTTITVLHADI